VEWSLDGPLPKLCLVIPTFNQEGHQAKNRKKGNEIKKKSSPLKLLSQSQPNLAILVESRDHWTQFWKRAIQGSFHKSLVAIGPVVSEEKIIM
jgi:hypothetical protein